MDKKAAVFCSRGLGDGLLFLVISNNLKINGYEVDTFHNSLFQLHFLFPKLSIMKYPEIDKVIALLKEYDLIIVNSDNNPINQFIKKYGKKTFPEKIWDLHPSTCKGRGSIIGDFAFNISRSMAENLKDFCLNKLKLSNVDKYNGIIFNDNWINRKYKKRIIIHPESSQRSRNWPKKKFVKLSEKLKNAGFDPIFVIPQELLDEWTNINVKVESFSSLEKLATYIFESGYMIGNDSGIGHLASNLNIPTLTIFSEKRKRFLWVPDWTTNKAVCPRSLPNIKGLRLRDKYWKNFIEVFRVYKEFIKLIDEENYEMRCF